MQARMLKEQQVEARRVIESLEAAIEQDGELLPQQTSDISESIHQLRDLANGECPDSIKSAIETLDSLTQLQQQQEWTNPLKQR